MSVDLQRAVEMCSFFYWALAVILDHPAPEDDLPLVVGPLQFQPCIVGIDSPAGEKMADFFCAHHHIHSNRVAPA